MSDEGGRDASDRVTSRSLNIARPASRLGPPALLLAHHPLSITHHPSRLILYASRLTSHISRLALYPSRITHHASLLLLLLLAGCAIPQVPSRIVYEDPVNYVRLEEDPAVLPEWPPGHHAHPADLGSELLRKIFSGMMIKEHRVALQRWIQGEAPLVRAFTDEEVALLSEQVAEALAKAQYNERVTFYLSQPQTSARRIVTSGGLYMRDATLHVLLGNWQIIYGIPTYGMIYDRRFPMRPTAAKGFDLLYQQPDAVIPVKSSWLDVLFANSTDELVIDLSKVKAPEPTPTALPIAAR
jgi:hypothetical protein